jgi:two-component system, OmpR family, response regulator RegX3
MKIAFLEDDVVFANEIIALLNKQGHQVDFFTQGRACLNALNQEQYDLALLDWEVPDVSGTEVLASIQLRGHYPPVVFLTGRDSEEDVITVIESGADDYIVKPINTDIFIARINALHRRNQKKQTVEQVVQYKNLTVDFAKRRFDLDGEQVKLTEKETDLALYFMGQIGVLLSRGHLTKVVWGTSPDIDTRTIDVHVSHLRSKLKLSPEFGWRLVSVYQQGYRLERLE